MVLWLVAVLLLIPLVDAALLLWVADQIGWVETVLVVVLTALIGTLLLRAEGRRTIRNIQRSLAGGNLPTNGLIDGGLLIASGAFLITPGLVTDTIGFLLVIPVTRVPIRLALKKFVIVPYVDKQTGGFGSGNVYTFGFPGDDDEGGVSPEDFDIGGMGGGTSDPRGPKDATTIDLGADEYTVDDAEEDVASDGTERGNAGTDEDENENDDHDGSGSDRNGSSRAEES